MADQNDNGAAGGDKQGAAGAGDAGKGAAGAPDPKAGAAAGAGAGAGAVDDKGAAAGKGAGKDAGAAGGADKGAAGAGAGGAKDDPAGKAAAKNLLKEGGTDKEVKDVADFPADWREKSIAASGIEDKDGKLLKQLQRLNGPGDMVKKIIEQEKLISGQKLRTDFPKDGTAEEQTAWRTANGIPETPDKYDTKLPDGMVIGERDKPIVDNMLKTMHGLNMNNEDVKAVLSTYYQNEKDFLAARDAQMEDHRVKSDDTLHKEWGGEYRGNVNRINALLDTFGQETQDALHGGIGADGMPLLNNPAVLRDLNRIAREINPVATITPGAGGNQMSSVDDEIKGIEAIMYVDGKRNDAYWKDEGKQKRYRELLDWKENQKKKAG